jgi:UbiD family decarboxylase
VTEVKQQPPDLNSVPFIQLWPEDGGYFNTLPLVYTESPSTGKHNLGVYRMQRFDSESTGMHWQIGKGGGFHYFEAEQRGTPLPVTVFLGGPPALTLAAVAPLPEGVPELLMASLLGGEKLRVRSDPRGGGRHRLIAEAEFAMSGSVAPFKRRPEGPFGDHYGYYSLCHDYPVFEVDTIFHRKDAIYPATVVGKPRQEDFYIGDYLQDLLSPLFPLVMPAVRDLWSYGDTGFHSLAAAVVQERYSREGLSAGLRILGEGQLTLTKFLLLTDMPQDLRNFKSVFECVLARADWTRDLFILDQTAFDTLDYASGKVNFGSKAIMIGCGKPRRELARQFTGTLPTMVKRAAVFCAGCLVLETDSFEAHPDLKQQLASMDVFRGWQVVILHDDIEFASSQEKFLWATWTRFNPATDIAARSVEVRNNHLGYEAPIFIDARMKPWYPKEVEPLKETVTQVDARWSELFPNGI